MRDVLPELERWHHEGKPIAIASVISIVGSAPRGVGATLALTAAGDIAGSVSGGCVEPAVIEVGLKTLRTGQPKILSYGITEEQNVEQIGLSCGGPQGATPHRPRRCHQRARGRRSHTRRQHASPGPGRIDRQFRRLCP